MIWFNESSRPVKGCEYKPLGLLGILLIIVGIGYFVGAGVTYSKVQGGYNSLQSLSEVENIHNWLDEDGQLVDHGAFEGAQAKEIMSLLEDDELQVVSGDMDPNDPLVNSASEYMYQMATISYHTLNGTQNVTITQDQIDAAIESERLDADGTYNGVVEAYQGTVIEPGTYEVPVNGRYWTGLRTDGSARRTGS